MHSASESKVCRVRSSVVSSMEITYSMMKMLLDFKSSLLTNILNKLMAQNSHLLIKSPKSLDFSALLKRLVDLKRSDIQILFQLSVQF